VFVRRHPPEDTDDRRGSQRSRFVRRSGEIARAILYAAPFTGGTFDMSNRLLAIAVALASTLAACATDPCSRNLPCPNDPQPSEAQRDMCRMQFDNINACNAEVVAYYNCQFDNAVCGADGRTDPMASNTRAQMNCRDQIANVLACCTRNPSSPSCM
jgi:hypothetical protein